MKPIAINQPPRAFKVVAIIALLWMLMGVAAWVMDLITDESQVKTLSDAQRQLYAVRPNWLFVDYGVAVLTGLLGTIGLLMRKRWTTTLFVISLIAVVIQFGYTFTVMNAIQLLGLATAVTFPAVIFLIGVFLVWYSMQAKQRGWLRG